MASPLWTPSDQRIANTQIVRFIDQLNAQYQADIAQDYFALQDWALSNTEEFWSAVWRFCAVIAGQTSSSVLRRGDTLAGARWFPEARLNFAENLLRYRDDQPALVSLLENGQRRVLTYSELYRQVAQLAASLRAQGVVAGDRVVGFLPNIPETVIAMLATTSIGAIWSSCSPDFGLEGVLDRFGQIEPKVIFSADAYYYNGKTCDCLERLAGILAHIDSIQQAIVIPLVNSTPDTRDIRGAVLFDEFLELAATEITFEQLPFSHPLYIMYSSGTTGAPKCIVHGAGGTLLQHLKEHRLLVDLSREDVFFYFTTCGWMMWNWLVSGLASGATLLLYDGSPFATATAGEGEGEGEGDSESAGEASLLLDAIDREGISVFGTSAKFLAALEKAGLQPRQTHKLTSLRTILSTGSPLSHESFEYVYRDFKDDVCLSSISGGTDILSCFVGGCPILPVYSGQIQAPGLGMAVDIWGEQGQALREEKGELICAQPFPSCPLGFYGDTHGRKFQAAYFNRFADVWAQGDYGEITAQGGYIIHGRSDAVLNPGGVRIGTAEIYRQVERLEPVLESIVIGQQWHQDVRVVLFVLLRPGLTLDEALCQEIRDVIRARTTPRHVPEKIIQVQDIPRTMSGKIVELAVRDAVHGEPVRNTDALANPEALTQFRDIEALQS